MYPTNASAGKSKRVLAQLKASNAEALRSDRPRCPWTITIGNTDLPAFISDGKLYIEAPLGHVFEAFAEDLSAFVSDLEIRVSNAGGATLSLDRDGRPVYGAAMAQSSVVPGGEQR